MLIECNVIWQGTRGQMRSLPFRFVSVELELEFLQSVASHFGTVGIFPCLKLCLRTLQTL